MSERSLVEVALFTEALAETRAFYARLLRAEPVAEWPGGAVFAAGDAKLLVHERAAGVPDGPPDEDHFALAVEDLDRACEELRGEGVAFLVEPREYAWGRSAYLRDPEGRLVELSQV